MDNTVLTNDNAVRKNLPVEKIIEYMQTIADAEILCFQQKQLIQRLEKQLHTEQKKRQSIKRPKKVREVEEPQYVDLVERVITSVKVGISIGATAGLVLGFLLAYLTKSGTIPTVLKSFIISSLVFFLIDFFSNSQNAQKKIKYERDLKIYNEEFQKYRIAIKKYESCSSVYDSNITSITDQLSKAQNTYAQTTSILEEYYNIGFIYEKYRRMIPIFTMLEYFKSGRCDSLIGTDGAYNLYEKELMMKRITDKMDDIIKNLESISYQLDDISSNLNEISSNLNEISSNQMSLEKALITSNKKLNTICTQNYRIEQNTAMNQYYSEVTASNTGFLALCEMFKN